jgi:FtsH-binding integral membrane protein
MSHTIRLSLFIACCLAGLTLFLIARAPIAPKNKRLADIWFWIWVLLLGLFGLFLLARNFMLHHT